MRFMVRQYWSNDETEKSLEVLRSLPKELGFVLIGGWAVYSYVNAQKSEDVDIAIDLDKLDFFRRYGIKEYEGISIKYSIVEGTTVDLFINGYADKDMPVPVSRVLSDYVLSSDGIRVVGRELLLLLKLWGYFGHDEVKIRKDVVDVASLVFYSGMDFERFAGYISEYKVSRRRSSDALLEYLDKSESLWEYISPSKEEFDALKAKHKAYLRRLFGYL